MPKSRGRKYKAKTTHHKHARRAPEPYVEPPPLYSEISLALASPHPLTMLMLVSSLLFVTDTRRNHPFTAAEDRTPMPREELFGAFMELPDPPSSGLLAVAAEMIFDDEVLRTRLRREVAMRRDLGPAWISQLSSAETYRAVLMDDPLGDGDNITLGLRLPAGHEVTCAIYIDHNLGTLVKDALLIPEPIATIVSGYRELADHDIQFHDIPLADAKARITAAIETAARTIPPFETEQWPASRALVEWMIHGLPDDGSDYERREWTPEQVDQLAAQFFASTPGAPLDDNEHRNLLESLLWYGTDWANGDPMRWSPVKIELIFMDWLPRKVVAPASRLAKAPDLLRAYVRFAHAEVGLRAELTQDTLAAIDEWEPEYQKIIRGARPQGVEAMLDALDSLRLTRDGQDINALDIGQIMLANLASAVGGLDELEHLDADPLPDELFSWQGIADDIAPKVQDVLTLVDRCSDDLFDVEFRTACRRLLARAASGESGVFRRNGKSETAAAAICWLVGKVNDVFSFHNGQGMQVKKLMSHFGQTGSPSQRAESLLRAGGFDCRASEPQLGVEYLTSDRRRRIITTRDRYWPPVSSM